MDPLSHLSPQGHLSEVAVFSLAGKLLSSTLYGYTDKCPKCYERCSKLKEKKKVRSKRGHFRAMIVLRE